MLRIGQVEATATQDGKYTDGSVAGGIAATRLRAAAFNAMQEELAHIVESAGLALDINDMTQVLKAIQKLTLSRANPFADIKSDGAAAISTALTNLRLAEAGNTSGKLALIGNVNTDTDKCAVVTKTGSNANGKYRIWSDGTIEVWGNAVANISGNAAVYYPISLPAPAQVITTTPLLLSSATPYKVRVPMVITDLTDATKATFLVLRSDGTTSADGFYWSARYAPF